MQVMKSGVCTRISHAWDALVGSDPGLTRLRQAFFAALAMSGALAIELGLSMATHADQMSTIVAMLLGAVIAMLGSNALGGAGYWSKVRTAAFFPVAMGVGIGLGIAVGTHVDVMLVTFVAVMFLAVYVRRFGADFFFYGFMMWMGYFFASFLHATLNMVPHLMLAIVLGTAWVLLLSVTVTRTNPRRTLMRIRASFSARARNLSRACAYLLMADPDDDGDIAQRRHKVGAQRGRLAEAALMIDGWSADSAALPRGWTAGAVRRRLVDLQLCLGQFAIASQELVGADEELRHAATLALSPVALHRHRDAAVAAEHLRSLAIVGDRGSADARRAAHHLAVAVLDYLELEPDIADPPDTTSSTEEFTPAVALAFGHLPGSPAVVRNVEARGRSWNPLSRLDFTTRQAVQVAVAGALAIIFGRMLDPHRYYWAVIAAFVAFTGTGTRSETTLKATNRVIGTVVGLFAGIFLAHATTGHTVWTLVVIVLSMSCGFYLVRISYAYMIFFVTIMVAQLYSVLHEFSDELLFLRLKETALGGLIGIVVGLFVTPVSTRDAVESVRHDLLTGLQGFLIAVHHHLLPGGSTEPLPDLDGPLRDLDNHLRALLQVGAPLTRPLLAANSPRWSRHQLTLYADSVRRAQALPRSIRTGTDTDVHLAAAVSALADTTRDLAAVPSPLGVAPGPAPAQVSRDLLTADCEIDAAHPQSAHLRAVQNDLALLHSALALLAGPRQEGGPGDPTVPHSEVDPHPAALSMTAQPTMQARVTGDRSA